MSTLFERISNKHAIPILSVAVEPPSSPPWWSALASLGWTPNVKASIEAVQVARGSGFLGSTYPNVLAVLKAGPGHKAAQQVVRVLEQLASPPGQGGTREGVEKAAEVAVVAVVEKPSVVATWSSLSDLDEAQRLERQLLSLVNNHCAGLYAERYVVEFNRAVASRSIKRARAAYCGVVEQWLNIRHLVAAAKAVGDGAANTWGKEIVR